MQWRNAQRLCQQLDLVQGPERLFRTADTESTAKSAYKSVGASVNKETPAIHF